MQDLEKSLFVGVKMSAKLQSEFDNCAPGLGRYFRDNNEEYLQVVTLGTDKFVGRFLKDGFPASDMENVCRNVRSIVQLIARGHRLEDDAVRIYAISKARAA